MPLKSGTSSKVISANIKELVGTKASPTRNKGIKTLAKNRGISYQKAKQIQAKAISYSKARKSLGSRAPHARVS